MSSCVTLDIDYSQTNAIGNPAKETNCHYGHRRMEKEMARLDPPTRDQIKEELRDIFDHVSAPPGGVGTGPMSVLKHSPEMSRRATPLFNYVRNESSLPPKIRELAMIVTARGTDCQYIWNVHAPTGRREGLSDALVDALKNKQPLPSMSPDEAAVVNLGLEFFSTHRVSQENFQLAWEQFGAQGLVELTTLMGFYAMLAFNTNAVELDPPLEPAEPLMPI